MAVDSDVDPRWLDGSWREQASLSEHVTAVTAPLCQPKNVLWRISVRAGGQPWDEPEQVYLAQAGRMPPYIGGMPLPKAAP